MNKIATHDSVTGESVCWFCFPFIPFVKTQSKTIKEQYEAGCRLFDIRVKLFGNEWKCGRGLWVSKRTAEDIFKELNEYDNVIVNITFEGSKYELITFSNFVNYIKRKYPMIIYGFTAHKNGLKPHIIDDGEYSFETKQGFMPLDGKSWHTYIHIPWLWKKIYYNKPNFNDDYYLNVDFL